MSDSSPAESSHRRRLGTSDLMVSPIGFGCWPIAGVSTLNANERDSLATLHAAIDNGINFFDTAYAYGYEGESERLIAQVLSDRRDEVVLATKIGQYFGANKERIVDGKPDSLRRQAEESLQRLGLEQVDILYLHMPDPSVPLADSAEAIQNLVQDDMARYAGVSNVTATQLQEFHQICPVVVNQPPFNMLQQNAIHELKSTTSALGISNACYWVLMKGMLTGHMARDHQFDPRDKRLTYPIYQGRAWQRSQDFLDKLRALCQELHCTVAQLVVAWTIRQPGVDIALCGAKRALQIEETAGAMRVQLDSTTCAEIDSWIAEVEAAGPLQP
ncbi:MAG: aldo/keto reductase [Planctomycetota bacterium]